MLGLRLWLWRFPGFTLHHSDMLLSWYIAGDLIQQETMLYPDATVVMETTIGVATLLDSCSKSSGSGDLCYHKNLVLFPPSLPH